MNVCMVGHFPPHLGGISSYTYLLSRELVKRGDEVYVLTYPHDKIKDIHGIHVQTSFTLNIKGLRGFFFFISATLKLIGMVRKYNIDLIHAHYIVPPGLIAVIVGMILGKRTAITIHGSDIFILTSNSLLKRLIIFVLKNTDDIFVVSDALKHEVLKLGIDGIEDKIKVTWNAVDIEKFKPGQKSNFKEETGLDPEKPLILFVGNLVPQKGVEYLISAKEYLESHAQIAVVGDGPLKGNLKAMVKNENIEGVVFTGERDDVHGIMPAADLVVLPSLSESFGIVLLEAMASGKPVVATDVGGIPEIVNDNFGIIVKPKDPIGLAKAIDKILLNGEMKDKMGTNARKEAMKYAYIQIPY